MWDPVTKEYLIIVPDSGHAQLALYSMLGSFLMELGVNCAQRQSKSDPGEHCVSAKGDRQNTDGFLFKGQLPGGRGIHHGLLLSLLETGINNVLTMPTVIAKADPRRSYQRLELVNASPMHYSVNDFLSDQKSLYLLHLKNIFR